MVTYYRLRVSRSKCTMIVPDIQYSCSLFLSIIIWDFIRWKSGNDDILRGTVYLSSLCSLSE